MSRRTERLASIIQQELAQIILHELADPRLQGFPSITRVKVSPDLGVADVFVTIMGSKGQQTAALNALQHSAGLMRSRLTRAVSLRQAPFLKFHIDEGAKKEIEILELIRKAAEETAEADRRRAETEGEAGETTPAGNVANLSPSSGTPGAGPGEGLRWPDAPEHHREEPSTYPAPGVPGEGTETP
ncbi:MAG TPA: 30S ribosome-binding factor RbfA [Tepidisphaeraceae bacterium]|jgi:ribosome-binding factor A|nr:30S ribosome-binding factor RbfA [Tepidisphaeraceae bacterium]